MVGPQKSSITLPRSRGWILTGFILSALGAMLFAAKGVIVKLTYAHDVGVAPLLAWRMLLSTPVFLLVGLAEWRRRPLATRPSRKDMALAALVGMVGYHLSSWLDFEGLVHLDAQSERLILFTYPFFVILLGWAIYRRPLSWHAIGGAVISYAGILAMFGGAPERLSPAHLAGAAYVLAAAFTFACYQLFAREMIVKCGAALFTAIAMSAAGASIMAQFFLTHPVSDLAVSRAAWPLVLTLALFATVVPAFLMSAGTARIGAQGNAIIATLSPVVTVVLAVQLLGEPFGWPEAVGTALVLAGVGFFTLVDVRLSAAKPRDMADQPSS
ncbi:EamA/RhaT family transporter [Pseudonocardia sp. TMWB2A]|uniref:DMT family transporter n=1 Tax=Pseudonocardia sp. TMWB2A TaxID=687430 RepID=UPI00307EF675